MTAAAEATVRRFVDRLSAQDWAGFAGTLAEDVERIGPYGDLVRGRQAYVEFLAAVVSRHPNYAVRERRVTAAADGSRAFAEITEVLTLYGVVTEYPEVLAFDLDGAGRISRVGVYMIRPDPGAARSADRFFERRDRAPA